MRLLQALGSLLRGFISMFIRDVALSNPEAAFLGEIERAKEIYDRQLSAAGRIKAELIRQKRALTEVQRQLAEVEAQLRVAVKTNRQQAGGFLIQKKQGLERRRDELVPIVEGLERDANREKLELQKTERFVRELQQRMDTTIARLRSAEARERAQELRSGLSVDGSVQMIRAIEDAVDQKVGRVELRDEIEGGSVERQLMELEAETVGAVADDEFTRLRAEFETSQGVTAAADPTGAGNGPGGKVA